MIAARAISHGEINHQIARGTLARSVTNPFVQVILLDGHFTPTRIPDIVDGIADICGGLTGAYLRKYI